jgi:hypothetical protein
VLELRTDSFAGWEATCPQEVPEQPDPAGSGVQGKIRALKAKLKEMQTKKGTIDVIHSVLKDKDIKHFALQNLAE